MHRSRLGALSLLVAALCSPAAALDIQLFDTGSTNMTADQLAAFEAAAALWEAKLADPITVKLNIEFASLDPNILGSTRSQRTTHPYSTVRAALISDASSGKESATVALLPTAAAGVPLNDINGSRNDTLLTLTTANAKALGLGTALDTLYGGALPNSADGRVQFATAFADTFDYDRNDGVGGGKTDFITVAAHEIGHALGFVSMTDVQDGNAGFTLHPSTLDMWRFSDTGAAHDVGIGVRPLTAGPAEYYDSVLNNRDLSRGMGVVDPECNTGSGKCQASHWRDDLDNLMDPTIGTGVSVDPLSDDRHAMDFIGYDPGLSLIPFDPRRFIFVWFDFPFPIPDPCLNCPPFPDFPREFGDLPRPPSFAALPKPDFTPDVGFLAGLDFPVPGLEKRSATGWASFSEERRNPNPQVYKPVSVQDAGEGSLYPAVEPAETLPARLERLLFQTEDINGLPLVFRDALGPGGAEYDPSLGKFGGYRVAGFLDGLVDQQQDLDGRLTLLLLADEQKLPDGKKQNIFTIALGGPDTTLHVLDHLALGVPLVGPGDADYDGDVDLDDFGLLKQHFGQGTKWGEGNFDALGATDLADFGILKDNFGKGGQAGVPEPSTWLLAALAALGCVVIRRRRPATRDT